MRRSGGGRRSGGVGIGGAFGNLMTTISENKKAILISAGVLGACVGVYFYLNRNSNSGSNDSSSGDFAFGNNNTTATKTANAPGSARPLTGATAASVNTRGGAASVSSSTAALAKEVAGYLMADGTVKAPEKKPTTGEAWYLLGTALLVAADVSPVMTPEQKLAALRDGGIKTTIEGKQYTSLDCYQEALNLNSEHEKAWLGAARAMFSKDKQALQNDTQSTSSFTVGGKTYDGLECTKEALRLNSTSSEAWCLLGWQITTKSGPVTIGDVPYTRIHAFVKAIEIDDTNSLAWLYLGTVMPQGNAVYVRKLNKEVNDVTCYVKSIESDKTNHRAWYALGLCIDSENPVMVNGQPITDLDCFVQVLNYNPANAEAWYNLGTVMPSGGVAQVQGSEVTEISCFQAALELNPNNGDAWYSLGVCLGPDQGIPYGENEVLTRRDCYIAAIAVDDTLYRAWYNLGLEADEGERITLADGYTEVDCLDCCAKSVEHNPQFAKGWYMLAKHLDIGEVKTIRGRTYNRQQCKTVAARLGMAMES